MKRLPVYILIFIFLFQGTSQAIDRGLMDRPISMGPQYPLMHLSTVYEPDSAFLLKPGEVYFQTAGMVMNTYVYSSNSNKNDNPDGSADRFDERKSGYSAYMDAEVDRRFFKTYIGLMEGVEFQLTYRDIRFGGGNLDQDIDKFHNFLGIGSQGRENTDRDQLEIYIYDNKTDKIIWQLTEGRNTFHQESMTLGLKFGLWENSDNAFSLTFSSNFGDSYIENEINEIEKKHSSTSFNDYNVALNYSSKFEEVSFYLAASMSHVKESLLEESPDQIYYYFLGSNFHLDENWDFLMQILNYTSPYPKDDKSNIDDDIREISMALRWIMGANGAFETGFVENQTQGPQNIDITLFWTLMVAF